MHEHLSRWMRALTEPQADNTIELPSRDFPSWLGVLLIFVLIFLISAIVRSILGYATARVKKQKPGAKGNKQRACNMTEEECAGEAALNSRHHWEDAGADTFLLHPDMATTHGLDSKHHAAQRSRFRQTPPDNGLRTTAVSGSQAMLGADASRGSRSFQRETSKSLDGWKLASEGGVRLPSHAWVPRIESSSSITASSMAMSAQQSSIAVRRISI